MTTLCQDLSDFSQDQRGMFSNGGQGVLSESIQKRSNEVESVTKFDSLSSFKNRRVGTHSNSYLNKHVPEEPSHSASDKSILSAARDADAWLAPGNIVWVKDIRHDWWPAEVMDTRVPKDNDYQHTARVFVQLFQIHERAWVDASDLSQFPDYFEERNKNPSEAFQDALKQALCKYENGSLRTSQEEGTAGEIKSPTQPEKSPEASKISISRSAKNDDHDEEEGRGKRKRKNKIHFDEVAVADNPARRSRRLKIMRLLGLAAPVGSPFSSTHKSS